MDFWRGTFSPRFTKKIGSVKLVALFRMTEKQWRILDYENLRNVAKNKVAEHIVSGKLVGFFHVHISDFPEPEEEFGEDPLSGHKAKADYFEPAYEELVDEWEQNQNVHSIFGNSPDVPELNPAAEKLDDILNGLSLLETAAIVAIVDEIAGSGVAEQVEEKSDELSAESLRLLAAITLFKSGADVADVVSNASIDNIAA